MKFNIHYLFFVIIGFGSLESKSQKLCGWETYYEQNKHLPQFIERIEGLNQLNKQVFTTKTDEEYVIPTVIHVIYKNSLENISKEQIESQLEVLNMDFRKKNADTNIVASGFSIADSKISFCLAQRDPDGNETTGITRTETNIDNVCALSSNQYYQLAPAWDTDKYLNIWVCDIDGQSAGYAFPPGIVAKNRDGVVIDYSNFGTMGTAVAPYDKGRSATHEVGHWFNLSHPWGNSNNNSNCNNDDGVSDTPLQDGPVFNCPQSRTSCGSADMLSNFMGFVDDACMANFTEGQKTRMRAALINGRTELITANGCLAVGLNEVGLLYSIQLFPNPANDQFQVVLPKDLITQNLEIEIYNLSGKMLISQTKASNSGLEIVTQELASGIYFIKFQFANEMAIKKFIIQH